MAHHNLPQPDSAKKISMQNFISYNKEYDINKLKELYQSNYFIKIKELEKVGVLILAFYWD
jgi:hypothetical protein